MLDAHDVKMVIGDFIFLKNIYNTLKVQRLVTSSPSFLYSMLDAHVVHIHGITTVYI